MLSGNDITKRVLDNVLGVFDLPTGSPTFKELFTALAGGEEEARHLWTIVRHILNGNVLAEGLDITSQELDAIYSLGLIQQAEGRHEAAIPVFSILALLNQNDIRAYKRMAASLIQLRKFDEALTYLGVAYLIDPEDAEAAIMVAECHIATAEQDQAKYHLQKAIEKTGAASQTTTAYQRASALLRHLGQQSLAATVRVGSENTDQCDARAADKERIRG